MSFSKVVNLAERRYSAMAWGTDVGEVEMGIGSNEYCESRADAVDEWEKMSEGAP